MLRPAGALTACAAREAVFGSRRARIGRHRLMTSPVPSHRVRLGEFQLDVDTGELSGRGTRVLLQVQSFELLKALLERPGQMVSREELRQRLWPGDTFVDFEHGLNAAVRRLREVLGDTADDPRFVETIPRRGYRLVAPSDVPEPMPTPVPEPEPVVPVGGRAGWRAACSGPRPRTAAPPGAGNRGRRRGDGRGPWRRRRTVGCPVDAAPRARLSRRSPSTCRPGGRCACSIWWRCRQTAATSRSRLSDPRRVGRCGCARSPAARRAGWWRTAIRCRRSGHRTAAASASTSWASSPRSRWRTARPRS